MPIVIIGGGIAGLYTALRLLDQGQTDIHVYEARERLGGNIFTHYDKNFHLEAGAGRYNSHHKKLLKLLKRFQLTSRPIPNEKWYAPILCPGKRMVDPSPRLLEEVVAYGKQFSTEQLVQLTFEQLCEQALGSTKANILIQSYGYDGDFKRINAAIMLEDFKEAINPQYYTCAEGLSELVKRLSDYLQEQGVQIHTSYLVQDVLYKDDLYTIKFMGHRSIKTPTLILAIPATYLQKLSLFTEYQKGLLEAVQPISLHRIYAKEPRPSPALRTTTDLPLRQYIPIDPANGIAMVSYSDDHYADYWKNYADQGIKKLNTHLLYHLQQLFPKDPPTKFEWILSFYWKEGVHGWKAGYHPKRIRKELKNLYPGLAIVGESYAINQAWIEGALDTVEEALPTLLQTLTKGGASTEQWVKLKLPNESVPRVIDVSKWMFLHPGGKEPYLQNMHQDITSKFKKISSHFDTNGQLKEHVLATINKYTIHTKTS